jgi:hypothetical protein
MPTAEPITPLKFELVCSPRGAEMTPARVVNGTRIPGTMKVIPERLERIRNGQRPDYDRISGPNYAEIADVAMHYNEAQIRAGFLDWLYYADVAAPIGPPGFVEPKGKAE